jgi:NAD(P)-dependent dehydrogenase (short-subunit alcohol dehydrogenase family)
VTRVALVTGGGSGIGLAVARLLLSERWTVFAAGRDPAKLAALERERGGAELYTVSADVSDPAAVRALFETVEREAGRLDLLFNNAGSFGPSASVEDVPLDAWQATIDVNVTGAFVCAQEAFRLMRRQSPAGGRIVNNGSVSASSPRPNAVAYTVTKHAITGLTKALSLEGRRHSIACGQIDIGNAATGMTHGIGEGALQADFTVRREPLMDVEHAARAVVFMASLPLDANVQFMTVMATTMPLIGRG